MNGKLFLKKKDELGFFDYEFNFEFGKFDYSISINTDLNDNFVDLISNSRDLISSIDYNIELSSDKDIVDSLENIKNNADNILKNIEYISFDFSVEEVYEYINKNPILKTKKIIIDDLDFDTKKLKDIKRVFGNNTNNLYFDMHSDYYNNNLVKFEDYSYIVDTIDRIVLEVNSLDFSNIEKIMYVYDIVRNRVYKQSKDKSDSSKSRSITSVLKTDEIVCAGYASLFKIILNKLGIKCELSQIYNTNKKVGHARDEVYVKDEKYNIDGVYYFDPTFDSKKFEDDNTYLLSYKYFAKIKTYFDELDKKNEYENNAFPSFSNDLFSKFKKMVDQFGLESIPPYLRKSINYMSYIVNEESLIDPFRLSNFCPNNLKLTKEEVYTKLKPLIEKFTKPINADTFLSILYNVRKKEYYIDPKKYQFSFNDFFKILLLSDWRYDEIEKTGDLKEYAKRLYNIYRLNGLFNSSNWDIEKVKFAKTLRLVYEKKKSTDSI